MDPQSFVEAVYGVSRESSMMPQSQFHNEFPSLNDVSIPENILDQDSQGNRNPINLDNIDVPEMEQVEIDIPVQERSEREKSG